jgi:hypothetical protein
MTAEFYIKAGDTLPNIRGELLDDDGNPADVSGSTITFNLEKRNGANVLTESASTVNGGQDGVVEYDWTPGDTDTPGAYRAEFVVDYGNGDKETFPNRDYIDVFID